MSPRFGETCGKKCGRLNGSKGANLTLDTLLPRLSAWGQNECERKASSFAPHPRGFHEAAARQQIRLLSMSTI
jgi:hypothetical protein